MANAPVPKEPGHVTVPEDQFRDLEEKARSGALAAARIRRLEDEVRSLRRQKDTSPMLRILQDLLVQIDHFDKAIFSAREKQEYAAIIEGLEVIRSGLLQTAERQGVRRFSVEGKPFDPDRHQLLEGTPPPGGCVAEEIRPGYEREGMVFRKAWVRLKGAAPSQRGGGPPPSGDLPEH